MMSLITRVGRRLLLFASTTHGKIAVSGVLLLVGGSAAWILESRELAILLFTTLGALLIIFLIDSHKKGSRVARAVGRDRLVEIRNDLARLEGQVATLAAGLERLTKTQEEAASEQRIHQRQTLARLELASSEVRAVGEGLVRTGSEIQVAQQRELAFIHADLQRKTALLEESLGREMGRSHRRFRASVRGTAKQQLSEVDALLQIHRQLPLDGRAPLLGGWAISSQGMLQVIDIINDRRPELIVECGPGTSTVYAAAALAAGDMNDSRIVGLEHLPEFAEKTRRSLKEHGLSDLVEIRDAPLVDWELEETSFLWYEPAALDGLTDIDLLIVDGPPGSTGSLARYPALPILRERLRTDAIVLLDDARRPDEEEVIERWLSMPGLTRESSLSRDQAILRFLGSSDG